MIILLYLLYFLSGLSALVYEVVWLRKLELVFGTTTYAVSTVLAVFFSGLAVGSWVFGKIADKDNFQFSIFPAERDPASRDNFQSNFKLLNFQKIINHKSLIINPLVLYGLLELGIGFYAVLTPWIFTGIEGVQASFWQQFAPGFGGFSAVTFLLSALGLILPTILMGGTFPVVARATTLINAEQTSRLGGARRYPLRSKNKNFTVRAQSRTTEQGAGVVGWLYGLNTLGAVLGVLAAGFFLIASIGVNQTIWVAALISLAVGLVALWLSRIQTNDKRI